MASCTTQGGRRLHRGIVTGFLAGYLVLWIKKVKVPKFVQPIMPIIVIPIVATTALGLFFIYVIGKPISWVFTHLTGWLGGMTGTSAILLGAILGLMIAFDMGGPVNKTAFLFGAGLIASGNQTVMGMCAAAIPVMPLGQGLATLIRRRLYSEQERETGMAALFMGLFGISEGAIPFAAARPAQVIPANMLGGAVAGALAGMAGVADAVPHGGPIVAVLGAVDGVPMFFVAVVIGRWSRRWRRWRWWMLRSGGRAGRGAAAGGAEVMAALTPGTVGGLRGGGAGGEPVVRAVCGPGCRGRCAGPGLRSRRARPVRRWRFPSPGRPLPRAGADGEAARPMTSRPMATMSAATRAPTTAATATTVPPPSRCSPAI